jgi:hypothetical protein
MFSFFVIGTPPIKVYVMLPSDIIIVSLPRQHNLLTPLPPDESMSVDDVAGHVYGRVMILVEGCCCTLFMPTYLPA